MTELTVVISSGVVGGLLNSYLQDGALDCPDSKRWRMAQRILKPGFIGNTFVGVAAALVMWGLYGAPKPAEGVHWEWAGHVAASILVGAGGRRVLTGEIEKRAISTTP